MALGEHAKLRTIRRKFRGVFLWVDRALGEAAENEIIKKFYSLGERHTPEDSERYVPFKTLGHGQWQPLPYVGLSIHSHVSDHHSAPRCVMTVTHPRFRSTGP